MKSYTNVFKFFGMILKFEDGTDEKLFSDPILEDFNDMEDYVSSAGGLEETLLLEDEHLVGASVGLRHDDEDDTSSPLVIGKLSLKFARLGN